MAMPKASPFPPVSTAPSPVKVPRCNAIIRPSPVQPPPPPHFAPHRNRRRIRRVRAQGSAAPSLPLPINVDYLEREFGGHGASFRGVGDSCVVKMVLGCGSTASLMLPSGLVTSYKPQMWHGTTVEVLQTSVSGGEGGEVVIQGGVSLGFKCRPTEEEGEEHSWWSPSSWALRDVRGSPEASIQVELVSADPDGKAEMKYLVTLQEDLLASELTVTNLRNSTLCLVGSVITHLKVSTPDATFAVGLQGSDYRSRAPIRSGFSIIPPGFSRKEPSISGSKQPWGQGALQGLLSGYWGKGGAEGEGEETEDNGGEEDDNYHQMTEKMSRIYTSAPREFTIIDRGRRNSVVVERRGFDEFYVFSPGAGHEWYGKYAYVCTGPSAILAPIVVCPGGIWHGGQYLHNPNM